MKRGTVIRRMAARLGREWCEKDRANRGHLPDTHSGNPPCPRCGHKTYQEEEVVEGGTVTGKQWGRTYRWCPVCGCLHSWPWYLD